MKVKLIIISIILLLVIVFACGCIPVMEKLGLVNPTNEEQLSPEKGGPPDGLIKVLIGFKEKPGPAQQAIVKGVGGQIKYTYHIVDAIAASIPEKAIDALQKSPNVRYVELDGEIFAVGQTLPWGVDRIDAEVVWTNYYTGQGVSVAIIDSGIDNDHPDLNVKDGVNFVSIPSWRTPDPNKWDDDNGHGTHAAGIVAALDNDIGVVGVAPGVDLYALKVLGRTGSGNYSDVIAAIEWCMGNSIQVTNNSYGSSGDPGETVKAAFDKSAADGILHVAAAGNGGSVIYPAAYPSVIAVSATDSSDNLASFSSIGEQVELAAPGVDIYSTYKGGGYTTMSGTSMACPHVAGVAALVIASGTSDVRGKLQSTAYDLGTEGRDSQFGYGLVDAENAVLDTTNGNNLPTLATGIITGTVTNISTGAGIEGAQVTADGYSDSTKSDGTYTLVDVAEGTYKVTVSAKGYENASQIVEVIAGTTSTANFALNPLPVTGTMYVYNIDMSPKISTAGPNTFYNAIATVTIVDENSAPVDGATVYGHWSGATSDSDSGVTDGVGQVSLVSDKVKNPSSGIVFTFTVDNVSKDGWTYDSPTEKPSGSITY